MLLLLLPSSRALDDAEDDVVCASPSRWSWWLLDVAEPRTLPAAVDTAGARRRIKAEKNCILLSMLLCSICVLRCWILWERWKPTRNQIPRKSGSWPDSAHVVYRHRLTTQKWRENAQAQSSEIFFENRKGTICHVADVVCRPSVERTLTVTSWRIDRAMLCETQKPTPFCTRKANEAKRTKRQTYTEPKDVVAFFYTTTVIIIIILEQSRLWILLVDQIFPLRT